MRFIKLNSAILEYFRHDLEMNARRKDNRLQPKTRPGMIELAGKQLALTYFGAGRQVYLVSQLEVVTAPVIGDAGGKRMLHDVRR
jgi:hypothetical protein